MRRWSLVGILSLAAAAGCGGSGADDAVGDDDDVVDDAASIDAPAVVDGAISDGAISDGATDGATDGANDGALVDAQVLIVDAAPIDAAPPFDASPIDAAPPIDAPTGVITGGPCLSGAPGATAYRIRWLDGGNTAYVGYEVDGLPSNPADHAGAYGYQIGFTPQFVDTFLAQGGLQLDGSDFVDLELSTVGVSQITAARLSIYGRSYNTTASGSFTWQTFDGVGAAPTNLVSNAAPYAWYTADMTTEISPGDAGVRIRIKAGPSSGSLVVNRIELCLVAQ